MLLVLIAGIVIFILRLVDIILNLIDKLMPTNGLGWKKSQQNIAPVRSSSTQEQKSGHLEGVYGSIKHQPKGNHGFFSKQAGKQLAEVENAP